MTDDKCCLIKPRFPIIEPDPGHTKLRLSREGLEAIEKITTPIAAVAVGFALVSGISYNQSFFRNKMLSSLTQFYGSLSLRVIAWKFLLLCLRVIGPYRSGKSFTLNQLLSLSCDEGFGVGHMRDTKTKGIWVWGTPVELDIDGVKTSVFYLDTEGFESIGKSNVYDDRIFALAAVMSSVLIYNLPETLQSLCFFSDSLLFHPWISALLAARVKGQDVAFEPAKLLWLIQRDFLRK
ncbi:putative transcription factor UNE12-like [Capsicum annuum]|nr:putative transcription factor UNE12-like [Capsicum annuum]